MGYDAFISYSHAADNVAAPALQRALHRFARPWNRLRALHVFRDQTSLAASPELWPAIEAALADARWLLLMASPEAAASHWVGREIDWWLTHRSPQTLLIILTGGAVSWDQVAGDFDWQRTSCLPRAVVTKRFPGEPLWVDLSWAKSADVLTLRHARFRQAVLDVAAPLHGRPKDELDGEDVRRFAQFQRIRTGAIAALAGLTTIAIAASVVAVLQRNEAFRQATIAHAGRLAAQSEQLRERGGPTDSSVMLAAEGLRLLDGIRERSADVDQALRRALASLFEERARLEISADEMRLTPDGAHLVAKQRVADQVSVHGVLDGKSRGCDAGALRPVRTTAAGERLSLIDGVSEDGAWCVMHVFLEDKGRHLLELWSAQPLRQVAQVTLSSRDGHVRPVVAPGGRWLAVTDAAQTGGASAGTVYLWSIADDGRIGEAQTLPGMAVIAFSPDGRYLATSAGLWQLPERAASSGESDATPLATRRAAWEATPWALAFSPDSRHVATQTGPDTQVVIWDVADGNDRLHASPPDGTLLALGPGGSRIVVSRAGETTVWDAELDVARAVLPVRAEAAALPGRGEAIFVVQGDVISGVRQHRVLVLPEHAGALASTVFPGAAANVQSLRFADGVAEFLEVELQQSAGANQKDPRAATGILRLHRLDTGKSTWSVATTLEGVTAFVRAPDDAMFAASAGGEVLTMSRERGASPQRLVPPIAASRLVLSGDGAYLIAYTHSAEGGALHVWQRANHAHWSVPLAAEPSAMAVTRDGRSVLALVESVTETRGPAAFQLTRWRLADPADKTALDLGRPRTRPNSICDVLSGRGEAPQKTGHDGIGVTAADIAGCGDAKPAPLRWRIEANGTRATAYSPAGASVARIEHPAKMLHAALSPEAREAVTLDESGLVQRFAIEPKDLIAQACRREPQALSGELHASLPSQVRTIDACGRKAGVEKTGEAKR